MQKMSLEKLQIEYPSLLLTSDFDRHAVFIEGLLSLTDRAAMEYHYMLLRDRSNRELYHRLRLAFIKRGRTAEEYLVEQVKVERDLAMQADLLHMLGRLCSPVALDLARRSLLSGDADSRKHGCNVLGWMGAAEDIHQLRHVLMNDPVPCVRMAAATAHSQVHDRLALAKSALLSSLRSGFQHEKDDQVLKWIIVTLQYISGLRFGLREIIEEGVVAGNISRAKTRCAAFLSGLEE